MTSHPPSEWHKSTGEGVMEFIHTANHHGTHEQWQIAGESNLKSDHWVVGQKDRQKTDFSFYMGSDHMKFKTQEYSESPHTDPLPCLNDK